MSCKTSDLRPQTSRRTSTAFSISVHFSLGLSPFVSVSIHFSTTQSIFHCSNPRFNTSIHLSSTRSIFQNLSPFVIASFCLLTASIHFSVLQSILQNLNPSFQCHGPVFSASIHFFNASVHCEVLQSTAHLLHARKRLPPARKIDKLALNRAKLATTA